MNCRSREDAEYEKVDVGCGSFRCGFFFVGFRFGGIWRKDRKADEWKNACLWQAGQVEDLGRAP
jgi:hypothetical protein